MIHRRTFLTHTALAVGLLLALPVSVGLSGCGSGAAAALEPLTPELSIASVALQSLSLTRADILLGVDARNPNPFALPLTGLEVDFNVSGVTLGRGSLPQATRLPARGAVRLPILLSANPLQLGTQAPWLLQQPSLPYEITGRALVGGLRLPIPLRKTGVLPLR